MLFGKEISWRIESPISPITEQSQIASKQSKGINYQMDHIWLALSILKLGSQWVGMTKVWSKKVRTLRWTSRRTTGGTTGEASGSTLGSLNFSDSFSSFELDINANQACYWSIFISKPLYGSSLSLFGSQGNVYTGCKSKHILSGMNPKCSCHENILFYFLFFSFSLPLAT